MHDGTVKIPCPNGCPHLSSTHQQANQHAKQRECLGSPKTNIQCPWEPYTGCKVVCATGKAMANHARSHKNETRSPYQCCKAGCGIFHADLYQLASHEERCKAIPPVERQTSVRIALTTAAKAGMPPSVIIVTRSSSERPQAWKAGTENFEEV